MSQLTGIQLYLRPRNSLTSHVNLFIYLFTTFHVYPSIINTCWQCFPEVLSRGSGSVTPACLLLSIGSDRKSAVMEWDYVILSLFIGAYLSLSVLLLFCCIRGLVCLSRTVGKSKRGVSVWGFREVEQPWWGGGPSPPQRKWTAWGRALTVCWLGPFVNLTDLMFLDLERPRAWNGFLVFCLATQTVENSSVVGFAWRGSSVLFGVSS